MARRCSVAHFAQDAPPLLRACPQKYCAAPWPDSAQRPTACGHLARLFSPARKRPPQRRRTVCRNCAACPSLAQTGTRSSVRWGGDWAISRNPCDAVKPPKAAPAKMQVYDVAQTVDLLEAIRGARLFPSVLLAVIAVSGAARSPHCNGDKSISMLARSPSCKAPNRPRRL